MKATILQFDETYQSDDPEIVVAKYLPFLSAVAKHTNRLNSSLAQAAAKELFKPSDLAAKRFGDAMAAALSYCRSKGCKATSGKKLSDPVKLVCLSFDKAAGAVRKFQDSMIEDSPPAQESPASSTASVKRTFSAPTTSVSSSSSSSASRILELYGVSPRKVRKHEADEVISSQEVLSSQDEKKAVVEVEKQVVEAENIVMHAVFVHASASSACTEVVVPTEPDCKAIIGELTLCDIIYIYIYVNLYVYTYIHMLSANAVRRQFQWTGLTTTRCCSSGGTRPGTRCLAS